MAKSKKKTSNHSKIKHLNRMPGNTIITAEVQSLIERGAVFYINHSGGKDSQAMTILLSQLIPKEQLIIIHSHLPEMEWPGIKEHIQATSVGIPVRITQAVKTFFQMVERRKMWPGMQQRQCTSDLKRGPLQKLVRASYRIGFTPKVCAVVHVRFVYSVRKKISEFRPRSIPNISAGWLRQRNS